MRELHRRIPPVDGREERSTFAPLEALGRSVVGIAPWLESPVEMGRNEEELKARYAGVLREAIGAAVDPGSPLAMNFSEGAQPLVDAAFLAQGLLRAPSALMERLSGKARGDLLGALRRTRAILSPQNNWLLFSAIIECAVFRLGGKWDRTRVDHALRRHMAWYKGDGAYGDGPEFHWDYYNSYVIHPMLIEILDVVGDLQDNWASLREKVLVRARRYAEILERLISPEGTYPPLGRSLSYRFGAFHLLSLMAYRHRLPRTLEPSQVRSALTAVIRRVMRAPDTFDSNGWLTIGLYGHQADIGERYISTGSLYLCTTVFAPLGLGPSDPFWTGDAEWTQKTIWSGRNAPADHALE